MDLGKDLSKAIQDAKLIVKGYIIAAPAIVQMKLIVEGGKTFETTKAYMRKFNPKRIESFEEELLDQYLGTMNETKPESFESITLHLERIKPRMRQCPSCKK